MDLYLHLNAGERDLLTRVLEQRLEDLRREIHHTDSRAFRVGLKEDETLLHVLLDKVMAPATMGI